MTWIAEKGYLELQFLQWMIMLLLILLQFFLADGLCSSLFLWLNKGWQRCIHCSLMVLCFVGWVDVVLNVAPTKLLLGLVARVVQLMELGLGMLPPLFWVSHLPYGCGWGCTVVV
ncbi:hypothetical protein Nepgr_007934 [Nepenthes gracilis]|uniref:Uncharacterized protein n=1 Tax=Nepenthes gracilis TaxID=150966 RepID=A0AAD3S812_NEPGR|nr:hypothetical protein Nepgr_007934 [Nepenthes gracilis]